MRWNGLAITACAMVTGLTCLGQEDSETLWAALRSTAFEGTLGTYVEYTEREATDADSGWGTGYLRLKLETAPFMRTRLGVAFLGYGELYSDADDGSDPYEADIEKTTTVPELYLNVAFTEQVLLTVGRFAHGKLSHLDDAQSEGAVVEWRGRENVHLVLGAIRKFAELDYDDGEDFGRRNNSQNLRNEATYGEDSRDAVAFAELTFSVLDGAAIVNPYGYVQGGYAAVYGSDIDVKANVGDVTLGARLDGCWVNPDDSTGTRESLNWAVAPFVKAGPVTLTLGYAEFGGDATDPAMNKPAWFGDYLVNELDQDMPYANQDCSVVFGAVDVEFDAFWAHLAAGHYTYDATASQGTASQELELQVGYQFTKTFDANVRLFDVEYSDVDDRDYRKLEFRARYRF